MAGQNVPTTKRDMLPWANTHKPLWITNAEQIGLTDAQAAAFKTLVESFESTSGAAEIARQASLDATEADDNAFTALRSVASAYSRIIKGFAESTNNPNVYALAGLKPNAKPGAAQPPIPPAQLTLAVNGDGSMQLKWKVTQPAGVSGVTYQVFRAVNDETTPVFVGTSTKKSFKDESLPFGTDRVTYWVQPVRGSVVGAISNQFGFRFGAGGGGGFASVKLAA
jgi:hypothetical protein